MGRRVSVTQQDRVAAPAVHVMAAAPAAGHAHASPPRGHLASDSGGLATQAESPSRSEVALAFGKYCAHCGQRRGLLKLTAIGDRRPVPLTHRLFVCPECQPGLFGADDIRLHLKRIRKKRPKRGLRERPEAWVI
jgi:hypothetical protein